MRKLLSFLLVLSILVSTGGTAFAASWTCPDCGASNDGCFCGDCGRDRNCLDRSETWFCTNCGRLMETDFCTNCGEKRSEGLVGSIVTFGAYEQDHDYDNGPEAIEWIVLAEEDDRILVVSYWALALMPFMDDASVPTTWDTCPLRQWMNGAFLNAAFSISEWNRIAVTTLEAEARPTAPGLESGVSEESKAGEDTQDKIFLLSVDEACELFGSDEARKCYLTKEIAAGVEGLDIRFWFCTSDNWWLRSPAANEQAAQTVSAEGKINRHLLYHADESDIAVRPALWITL